MLFAEASPFVDQLKDLVSSFPDVSLAIIYGSRATGRHRPDSDLDLAAAQGLFLREVLLSGRLLFQRDPNVLAGLTSKMLVFTEDMLPNIRMMRRSHKERLLAGE